MPVVWSDRCLLHDPGREIWVGLPTEASEVPARMDRILDTLARPDLVTAQPHDDEILKTIHDEGLLRYLQSAWVTQEGYREAGTLLGSLGLPTVFVQEGGYDLETIGPLVLETLLGFEAA